MLAQGIKIHFAHRTFSWSNEARGKAAVHCVIIGFGLQGEADKTIYEYADIKGEPHAVKANNINPYLVDAPDVLLTKSRNPISKFSPTMIFGSMPNDGGFLLFNKDGRIEFLKREPKAVGFLRVLMDSEEFINSKERWCLWLENTPPNELKNLPNIFARLEGVKMVREASTRPTTKSLAKTPSLFGEIRQPKSQYLAFPEISSESRLYIPISFLDSSVIATNKLYTISAANKFHFSVLTSSTHMAWVRTVCGRLKSDYQYSTGIVYNNFPWPDSRCVVSSLTRDAESVTEAFAATSRSYQNIEVAAQAVLDARAIHPNASLADLYDPLTMPANLLKAHQALDKAVDAAYGYKGANTDAARVAFLFERYQQLTSLLPVADKPKKPRKKL